MEKDKTILKLFFIISFFISLVAYSKPIEKEKAIYYEVALVKRYFNQGDWLSIVKTSRLLLKQNERDTALQTILWAERLIGSKQIINGAYHLIIFYSEAQISNKKEQWERLATYWKNKQANKWKNN